MGKEKGLRIKKGVRLGISSTLMPASHGLGGGGPWVSFLEDFLLP